MAGATVLGTALQSRTVSSLSFQSPRAWRLLGAAVPPLRQVEAELCPGIKAQFLHIFPTCGTGQTLSEFGYSLTKLGKNFIRLQERF